MPRKKTRFVVSIDGQHREVFSIGEGRSGDLTILLRGSDNHFREIPQDDVKPVQVENRISIHRSQRSVLGGTTVMRTLVTGNGEVERSSAFIKNSKKNLIWHVFSCLAPNLRDTRYDPSSRAADRIEVIADQAPMTSCLIYHIFVTSKGQDTVVLTNHHLTDIVFKHFNIIVYCCYVNIPTTYISATALLPTSSPTVDGSPYKPQETYQKHFPNGALPLKMDEVWRLTHTMNQNLYNWYAAVIKHKYPGLLEKVDSIKPYFSKYPLEADRPFFVIVDKPDLWTPPIQE